LYASAEYLTICPPSGSFLALLFFNALALASVLLYRSLLIPYESLTFYFLPPAPFIASRMRSLVFLEFSLSLPSSEELSRKALPRPRFSLDCARDELVSHIALQILFGQSSFAFNSLHQCFFSHDDKWILGKMSFKFFFSCFNNLLDLISIFLHFLQFSLGFLFLTPTQLCNHRNIAYCRDI